MLRTSRVEVNPVITTRRLTFELMRHYDAVADLVPHCTIERKVNYAKPRRGWFRTFTVQWGSWMLIVEWQLEELRDGP